MCVFYLKSLKMFKNISFEHTTQKYICLNKKLTFDIFIIELRLWLLNNELNPINLKT